MRIGRVRQRCTDCAIRRDAAGDHQHTRIGRALAHHRHRMLRPVRQHLGHRVLEAGGDVGGRPNRQRTGPVARHLLCHRGLQAGEAEVASRASQQRPRERKPPRIAAGRQLLQRRPARPAQPEQLRHLVERLARGIVHRAAQPHVPPDTLHRDALAVSAGNQQQQVGERHPALDQAGQPRGQRVRLQVVHRHIGQPVRDRDALGEQAADDQPADQPRAGAGRHASQIGEPQPRPRHHAAHLLGQERQMRARGDLRHHPAIRRVLALLAQHRLGEHAPALVQHRRRRLVARGLDAQHRAHPRKSDLSSGTIE